MLVAGREARDTQRNRRLDFVLGVGRICGASRAGRYPLASYDAISGAD
jgi:hypothetical protein